MKNLRITQGLQQPRQLRYIYERDTLQDLEQIQFLENGNIGYTEDTKKLYIAVSKVQGTPNANGPVWTSSWEPLENHIGATSLADIKARITTLENKKVISDEIVEWGGTNQPATEKAALATVQSPDNGYIVITIEQGQNGILHVWDQALNKWIQINNNVGGTVGISTKLDTSVYQADKTAQGVLDTAQDAKIKALEAQTATNKQTIDSLGQNYNSDVGLTLINASGTRTDGEQYEIVGANPMTAKDDSGVIRTDFEDYDLVPKQFVKNEVKTATTVQNRHTLNKLGDVSDFDAISGNLNFDDAFHYTGQDKTWQMPPQYPQAHLETGKYYRVELTAGPIHPVEIDKNTYDAGFYFTDLPITQAFTNLNNKVNGLKIPHGEDLGVFTDLQSRPALDKAHFGDYFELKITPEDATNKNGHYIVSQSQVSGSYEYYFLGSDAAAKPAAGGSTTIGKYNEKSRFIASNNGDIYLRLDAEDAKTVRAPYYFSGPAYYNVFVNGSSLDSLPGKENIPKTFEGIKNWLTTTPPVNNPIITTLFSLIGFTRAENSIKFEYYNIFNSVKMSKNTYKNSGNISGEIDKLPLKSYGTNPKIDKIKAKITDIINNNNDYIKEITFINMPHWSLRIVLETAVINITLDSSNFSTNGYGVLPDESIASVEVYEMPKTTLALT